MNLPLLKNLALSCLSYPVLYISIKQMFCVTSWGRMRASVTAWDVYHGWGLALPTLVFTFSILLSFVLLRYGKLPAWVFYVLPLGCSVAFNYAFAQWAQHEELSIMLYTLMPCALLSTIIAKYVLADEMLLEDEEESDTES